MLISPTAASTSLREGQPIAYVGDADGDRLSDVAEGFLGSDPSDADSDDDGQDDLAEALTASPWLADRLGELVQSGLPSWVDDSHPPPFSLAAAATTDTDGDGLTDDLEAFWGTDPNDPDTDHDGLGDVAEFVALLKWGIGSPTDPDHDDDGIDDLHDDYDGDGLSNLDEGIPSAKAFLPDIDFDGLGDGEESALGFDPLRHDTDGNGLRDSDEDDDGDGLGIVQELAFGTDPTDPDTDDDGVSDGSERALRTDPHEVDSTSGAFCLGRTPAGVPDWKLFQRGPDGRATIPVPYRYRLAQAGRLEVTVVDAASGTPLPDHGYANHHAVLAPFTAADGIDGVLDVSGVPTGGNYDLFARVVDPASGAVLLTDEARALAVGDVFLAAGQSNMSGANGWWEPPAAYEQPDPRVHLFGNDYRWRLAAEPMDDPTDSVDVVSIDSLARSSPMLRFAKEVARGTGVPIAVVPASRSGSGLLPRPAGNPYANRWARNPSDPFSRTTLYGSAAHRVLVQGYSNPIRGVIWYQGEGDVGQPTTVYRDALAEFVTYLRTDLASPGLFFASFQLAGSPSASPSAQDVWMQIREAQRQYAAADPQSTIVATVDVPAIGLHLLGPGYREIGRRLGLATLRGAYRRRVPSGPILRRTRLQRHGLRVSVYYDRRVVAGKPSLYGVVDGDRTVAVLEAVVSGRRVKLELAEPVTTGTQVTYGLDTTSGLDWVSGKAGEGAVLLFRNLGVGVRFY